MCFHSISAKYILYYGAEFRGLCQGCLKPGGPATLRSGFMNSLGNQSVEGLAGRDITMLEKTSDFPTTLFPRLSLCQKPQDVKQIRID